MNNVLTSSAKSVLVQLGLTSVIITTYAAIQNKIYELKMDTLKISNK